MGSNLQHQLYDNCQDFISRIQNTLYSCIMLFKEEKIGYMSGTKTIFFSKKARDMHCETLVH